MIYIINFIFCLALLIFNPITLNIIFKYQMAGKVFTSALIIFDLIIIILIYSILKLKSRKEALIVFLISIFFIILAEIGARNYLYSSKKPFEIVLKQPVFFEYERENLKSKFYKCSVNKFDYYHKLYFFSAPQNLNCDGWTTIKSYNGPWIRNTKNFIDKKNINNIWFFGGSTMYNSLVSDEDTIPSLISKKLNTDGYEYFIENFGMGGLDLHYEISNFFNLLRFTKNPPEIVVFYDGYNDVFNKIEYGGEFFLFSFMQSILLDKNSFHKSLFFLSEELSEISVLYKNTFGKKIKLFNINRLEKKPNDYSNEDIAFDYLNSIKTGQYLSKLFNIKVFFFLQPAAFSRENPVGVEIEHHAKKNSQRAREIYSLIIKKTNQSNFYDLSNIFDDYNKQFFYDFAHLSKKGNVIVANKMYDVIFN